ncbi:MAG: hypothetical protein GC159_23345 [Phycisphaera sp.]|nr:hypothetical protein [Phycisphaera sp.]
MHTLPVLTDELLEMLEDIARQFDELGEEIVYTLIDPEELDELREAWDGTPGCYRNHLSVLRRRRQLTDDADFDDRLTRRYAKSHLNPLTLTRCQHLLADGHYLYRCDNEEIGELEDTFSAWTREQVQAAREACLRRIAEELAAEDAVSDDAAETKAKPPVRLPDRMPLNPNYKNPGYKPSKAKANKKIRIAKSKANAKPKPKPRAKANAPARG